MSQPEFIDIHTEATILSADTTEVSFVTVETEPLPLHIPNTLLSLHPTLSSCMMLTFNKAEQYVVTQELKSWKNNVKLKYFNDLYKEH
jgi:hypothetical protein